VTRARNLLVIAALVLVSHPAFAADEESVPVPSRTGKFAAKADGVFAYRRIYDVGIYAGGVAGSLGAEWRRAAFYVDGAFWTGRTEYGLGAREGMLSMHVELKFERFRIGAGLGHGFVELEKATHAASSVALTVGPFALATFDLVELGGDHRAVYLRTSIDARFVAAADAAPVVWGPAVGLGARF
jgi:hypothetical protein